MKMAWLLCKQQESKGLSNANCAFAAGTNCTVTNPVGLKHSYADGGCWPVHCTQTPPTCPAPS